jgi:hypothetical protein
MNTGINFLKKNKSIICLITFSLSIICCQYVKTEKKILLNEYSITKTYLWPEIAKYINRYKDKSTVFKIQVINDNKSCRVQISNIAEQNYILNHTPVGFEDLDSILLIYYNGLESFNKTNPILDKINDNMHFKKLLTESEDTFRIYHPTLWEYSIDNNKNIIVDTTAIPLIQNQLPIFSPPPIH